MSKKVTRLFEQFQPEHYELRLEPDRGKMTFKGNVVISGHKVGRPGRRITFHQNGLKITSAKITKHGKTDEPVNINRINNQNSLNEVRLHSSEMIYPGRYSVELAFSAKITRAMHGIYPCFYKHNGQDKQLIMTQFESHHAREALPCIDEPEAKAAFDLTLVTPKGETVLANTPVKTQTVSGENLVTTFETTPLMSTYLLAFIFGELQAVSGKSKSGVTVSTWATIAQPKSHLNYATKEAIDALNFFEDYFKTPFPLKKLDQVAVPDFEVLGMENWGLITGREIGFLNDPKNRSISGERLTTMLIAHEVAHMWFGDLVTMKWWDDLWLNESFASIMETLAPDRLHPDWHDWEDFTAGRVLGAANRDVYKDVQSVGVTVNRPDEIHTLFDPAIVYAKGARILKMLHDYIGDDAFRAGLKSYFKKYAYKNTTRDDLWAELSKSSGQDISSLMNPWIEQPGTPELSVKQGSGKLSLTQQRFLLDGEDKKSIWPIPLLSEDSKDLGIMRKKSASLSLSEVPLFNPEGNGHFIVNYLDQNAQQNLVNKIVNRQMSPSGRIIAINDMLLQTQKGKRKLTEVLELVEKCKSEDRDAVWTVFMRAVGYAQILTDADKKVESEIRAFKRLLANSWYKKLGWDDRPGDNTNTKHLRITAVALSISGENQEAIKEALARYAKAGSVEDLQAEQRSIVAGAAVRFGKPQYIENLMKEYENTQNRDVQQAITAALCSTRDIKVVRRIEKWGMNNFDIIKPQDIDYWFGYLMQNHYTREVAWEWLHKSWEMLNKVIGEKKMEYFVWYSSRPISAKEWQNRYIEFFKPKLSNLVLKRNITISFSEIETRVKWRMREEKDLQTFFAKFKI